MYHYTYVLSQWHTNDVYQFATIGETANPNWLRQMFKITAGTNTERSLQEFVREEFEPHFEELARTRMKVSLPECEELEADTSCFLEAFFKDVA